MRRHTSALLGVALTELQKWDPAAAGQIAAHIHPADLPGVRRGMADTGVVESPALSYQSSSIRAEFAA
jgi:hypothetical protein